MPTFRDDLVRVGKRILETVEERTGREVVRSEDMQVLEATADTATAQRKMWNRMLLRLSHSAQGPGSSGTGRMPKDVSPMLRIAAAANAQEAWVNDPMAGQMVDLYVSFVFGRGVPTGIARDPAVQDILDATWDDEANRRVLTSFPRLVEKGIDLSLQSSVFWRFFDDGEDGRVRATLATFEDIIDVVRHEQDKYRITYYRGVERPVTFDFANARYTTPTGKEGEPKTVYYEAYGGFDPDNPVMVRQDEMCVGPLRPPADMLRPGKIVHLAVNKTSEMAFGVPRMNRLTRWWTAYNEVLESHVNRMKAMAAILMTQTVDGNQRDMDRTAAAVNGRQPRFRESRDVGGPPLAGGPDGPPPPALPGMLQQNAGVKHEPFKIDSGASDVAASIPQLRAQASGIFPPTYYGQDAGALAGQQSVELPVLKFIERDQEAWADVFRALGDAAVKAAIRVGDLTEWRDPTERELEALAAAEEAGEPAPLETNEQGQVKRDLGFDLHLPSPLKRAMGDIVTAAVQTAAAVDPAGENPEMSRWLFGYLLADAFDVEDPQRIVDQVLPRHVAAAAAAGEVEIDPVTGRPVPPAEDVATVTGPDGKQHPVENPGGAPVSSPQPEERPVREATVEEAREAVARGFDDRVYDVADDYLKTLQEAE